MLVRLFVSIALVGTTAFAGWERHGSGVKGGFSDSPPPHPLAYYLVDPCLRPASDALTRNLDCTWDGAPPPSPAERERRANTHTDLVLIGKIGEFTIYDLRYSRNGFSYPDPDLRSVLINTAPDEYREIDVYVRRGVMFPSSEIVEVGGEPILIAKSHDGGNHSWIDEVLYMFRQSGPETPDFKAVGLAVTDLKPPNMSILTARDDFPAMTYVVEMYRNDLNLPTVFVKERGRITVTYRFVDGRAIVTGAKFDRY
jgi:hypothetical protein